jgi:ferredoxin-NADP reductase
MSILRSLESSKSQADIVHIHYAKTRDDVIFRDELIKLKNRISSYSLIQVYTRGRSVLQSLNTRISAENISNFCNDWTSRPAFICGPAELLDEAELIWAQNGISEKLIFERFQAKKAPADANAAGGKVRFVISHFEVQADASTPLLKVAEAAGLNPAHGCRMGICHGCDAVLRSGEVRDLRTGSKISCHDNVRVQLCVSAAAGDVDLEI